MRKHEDTTMQRNEMRILGAAVILALGAATAAAQRPVREARSDNGRFLLRVNPGRPGRVAQGCEATLYERGERAGAERRVWQRAIVNDTAPLHALVRDDGRFVVTLDEHRRGGARNPLVIYGAQGELLRHFLLTDLLEAGDWPHVKATRREARWLDNARLAFDDSAQHFVIQLSWGRELRIDLRTLRIVPAATRSDIDTVLVIPADIAAVLFGHDETDGDSSAAEPLAGLAELTPEEQERAAEIAAQLSDIGGETTTSPAEEPVPAASALEDSSGEAPAAAAPDSASMPEEVELAMPPPDPAEKVDYVAWLNEVGRVEGPEASPVYDAAFAEFVPWDGDTELLAAAARGDPGALASPELEAWLAANAGALTTFREATQYPAKRSELRSPDGTVMGVLLPDLGPLRTLARAAVIEGRQLAAAGRANEAAERYLDALAAGAHTGNGLTLIENLVGTTMQVPAAEALMDLQAEPLGDELDYAALSHDAVAAYQPTRAAAEMLQGERAFYMDAAQRMWDYDPHTGTCVLNTERAGEFLSQVEGTESDPGRLAQDLARVAEIGYEQTVAIGDAYYDALTAAVAQPYPQASVRLAQIEDAMAGDQSSHPFLQRLTPSLTRYVFLRTRGDAARNAALLVTHLNSYRQAHGEYPASLDALGDRDFVVDPFSAAPFVYRRTGEDFVLYSVGGNGADNGGVHDRKGETSDLVFWPRPK